MPQTPGAHPVKKSVLLLAVLSLAAALLSPVTSQAKEPPYRQPLSGDWDTKRLDVIVVPPAHGQIYNGNGPLNNLDPNEVGPNNSYVRATEDSIAEWQRVVRNFGPK